MTTHPGPDIATGPQLAAKSAILLAFIVAFEIVIMISPFALFFYAVFNPVLLALDHAAATRWLTAFFLSHMIVPPDTLLAAIRVAGSVVFVVGMAAFLVCAIQVYVGRLWRTGAAMKGMYAVVRHPQYASLAEAGIGLAIMWPRFLTLALLAVMLFLYYLLAKDEERRMLARYGDGYRAYVDRTGMFLPRSLRPPTIGPSPTARPCTPSGASPASPSNCCTWSTWSSTPTATATPSSASSTGAGSIAGACRCARSTTPATSASSTTRGRSPA